MTASNELAAIRIVLCDDVAEVRALIRDVLEDDPAITVVGEAVDGDACTRAVADLQPDALLLDLSMPGSDGLEVLTQLAESSPNTAIVVFSGFAADWMLDLTLEFGADAYIEKGTPLGDLVATVRAAVEERRAREVERPGRRPGGPAGTGHGARRRRGLGPLAALAVAIVNARF